jgi:hypothetical protein
MLVPVRIHADGLRAHTNRRPFCITAPHSITVFCNQLCDLSSQQLECINRSSKRPSWRSWRSWTFRRFSILARYQTQIKVSKDRVVVSIVHPVALSSFSVSPLLRFFTIPRITSSNCLHLCVSSSLPRLELIVSHTKALDNCSMQSYPS